MSLIEGDAYFPLFSTAEIPIDFSAAGLVPDSPGKLQQFTRRPSLAAISNSQAVPANINLQNLGLDEPLFSLFMNGPDKMDINGGFAKGFQIPEELLLQSNMVPDFRSKDMMGMDQRQLYHYSYSFLLYTYILLSFTVYTPLSHRLLSLKHTLFPSTTPSVQMGMIPSDPMVNGDFNMVPQMSPNGMKQALYVPLATPLFSLQSLTFIAEMRTLKEARRGSLFKTR